MVALGQAWWTRWEEGGKDEKRRGGEIDRERMDGGKREGKAEPSALCLGWRCVWGRCFCLLGLRGGGTGMVERLAIHRPGGTETERGFRFALWAYIVFFFAQTFSPNLFFANLIQSITRSRLQMSAEQNPLAELYGG